MLRTDNPHATRLSQSPNLFRMQVQTVGAAAQVFRTYNASVTLDRLLTEQEQAEATEAAEGSRQRLESPTVDKRKADYDRANKEVRKRAVTQICTAVSPLEARGLLQNSARWTMVASHHEVVRCYPISDTCLSRCPPVHIGRWPFCVITSVPSARRTTRRWRSCRPSWASSGSR